MKLLSARNGHVPITAIWLGAAVAILTTPLVTAATSPTASANNFDRADIEIAHCETDGVHLSWRTENEGQAAAPDGWKVERIHRDSEGNRVAQTFTFIGDDADALVTSDRDYWDWTDDSVAQNVSLHLPRQGDQRRRVRHGRQNLVAAGACGMLVAGGGPATWVHGFGRPPVSGPGQRRL